VAVTYLLDVNVLMALLWEPHIRHAAAFDWFRSNADSWATTPTTQLGFVRVASNSPATRGQVSPSRAMEALEVLMKRPGHVFWAADLDFIQPVRRLCHTLTGGNQTTDAYLMALAAAKGGRLATFDGGIRQLVKSRQASELVEIIEDPYSGVQ